MKTKFGIAFLISLIILVGFLVIPGAINRSQAEDNENQAVYDENSMDLLEGDNTGKEVLEIYEDKSTAGNPYEAQDELILEHRARKAEGKGKLEFPDQENQVEQAYASGKLAYLTFDDGPSKEMTPQILQVLDRYEIRATFFVLGKMVDKNPDVLRLAYEKGHEIGNHTYSHNYDIIYGDTDSFLEEVYQTEEAIKKAVGDPSYRTSLVRLPGGSHAEYKRPTVVALEEAGFSVYDWNALNGDSELDKPTRDYLYNRFKETYRKQDQVIILMHDTDEKHTTLEALPSIIEHLFLEGYSFRTLEEYNH